MKLLANCLVLVSLFNFQLVISQTVDEVEYVTYRVISEDEVINKNNGNEPQCRKEYEDVNNNTYITPEERLKECQERWQETVLVDDQCYKDDYMDNSCAIKCYERDNKKKCRASVDKVRRYRFVDKQCGPQHYCNQLGCCEKRETTSTPTTVTTTATASTRTTQQTITEIEGTTDGTTKPTTTSHSTTVSTASTSPDQFTCPHPGDFADERDPSAYWHCLYEVEEILECDEFEIFDKWNEKCVFDWGRFIKCDKVGYFKNPFDCHKFYWCYKAADKLVVDFFTCAEDVNGEPMVWDEEKVSCVSNQNDTLRCDDRPLPIDNTTKNVPNDSLLEEDVEFRFLYEKNIKCEIIGRFRNPFDCHKYYSCYDDGDILLEIELYKCKDELMVFDERSGKCVDHSETSQCHNRQIPAVNGYQLPSYDNWFNQET